MDAVRPPTAGYSISRALVDAARTGLCRRLATRRADWPVWLVALTTLLNGMLSVVYVMATRHADQPRLLGAPLPFGLYRWSRSLTLVFGFVLIYLSWQLLQRRRTAWWLALAGGLAAAAAHLGHGHLWMTAAAPLALVVLLLAYRGRFTVHSEPRSIAQGLGLAVASLTLALVYGALGFWLLDRREFGIEFGVVDSLLRTARELALLGNPDLVPRTRHARWFLESLHVIGLTALFLAFLSLFRPVAFRLRTLPQQRQQVEHLLATYGGGPADFFKLLPDKSYFLSPDGQCATAYHTVWSVAISLGDPVGPAEEMDDFLRRWLRFCNDNGWSAAFHQVLPDHLPVFQTLGMDTLKIGEEAVVDVQHFLHATFPQSKHLRKLHNRFVREGYTLVWHDPPHSTALLDEAQEVSDEWLSLPGHRERGFSLGSFSRGYLNETAIVAVRDGAARMVAFVNVVPSGRRGEATFDLMRHRLEAPNGTMDFLFIDMMRALADRYRWLNMGMAPFAGVGEEPDAALHERVARELSDQMSRWVSYKGIRAYKSKFDPLWEDRYLVYQGGTVGLLRTALALTRAIEG
ncbi:MAG: phosphatidylglycerol lysyltransferase domain-containing protein [Caldilineales bacterium]